MQRIPYRHYFVLNKSLSIMQLCNIPSHIILLLSCTGPPHNTWHTFICSLFLSCVSTQARTCLYESEDAPYYSALVLRLMQNTCNRVAQSSSLISRFHQCWASSPRLCWGNMFCISLCRTGWCTEDAVKYLVHDVPEPRLSRLLPPCFRLPACCGVCVI